MDTSLPLYLGGLGLRPWAMGLPRHHFATFLQKPQMWSFHLHQHNSTLHRNIALPSQ